MECRTRVVRFQHFCSSLKESFHYKAVKMHEAIYNAQGRFHISENKANMRDLFHFSYNFLKKL